MIKRIYTLVTFIFCLGLCGLFAKSSAGRTGNQAYVTFDIPRGIALEEGLKYYDAEDADVKMDIYYPKRSAEEMASNPLPCILVIHGGGWRMGNEKKWAMYSAFLASQNFVVACISYRLMPEFTLEDCVYDTKKALYYFKKNAPKYGGDAGKMGVTGGSAGGHLSALLALSSKGKLFEEVFADGTDDTLQACVAMAPVMDLRPYSKKWFKSDEAKYVEMLWKMSPIRYVSKDSPPMLLLHSERDSGVPVAESLMMQKAYDVRGLSCQHIFYDSGDHAFWNTKPIDPLRQRSWQDSADFFTKILKASAK